MKRRKFLLTSGTALLGSTALNTASQRSVLGLNFDLVGTESVQPSNADSILIDFQNFELVPRYVDESAGNATVTITLDVEGFDSIKNQTQVSFENGVTKNKSDLGSAVPLVLDGIDTTQNALDGTITVSVDHTSVSDSYKQSFTITDDSLQQGLVGYWPMHEWSGSANDIQSGNNGSISGGVIQGSMGRSSLTSYYFGGDGDYVNIGQPSELDTDYITVSAWINPEITRDYNTSNRTIYGDDWSGSSVTFAYSSSAEYVSLIVNRGNEYFSASSSVGSIPESSGWHHVVGIFDGESIGIYVDGDLSNSETYSGSSFTIDSPTTDYNIGWDGQSGNDRYFEGNLSQVRVYNRSLSESEIGELYNLGTGDYTQSSLHNGSDSGAVSRYKFDSGSVTTDSWGSNTLNDNTSTDTTANAIRGDAKVFQNSDTGLDTGISTLNYPVTISLWLYPQTTSNVDVFGNFNNGSEDMFLQINDQNQGDCHYTSDGGANIKTQGGLFQKDSWNHLVVTVGSGTATVYSNGVAVSKDTGGLSDGSTLSSGESFIIGSRPVSPNPFVGYIDDFRIYNRSLSQVEVQQLYQWGTRGKDLRERTTTLNKSDMLGWWKLNETSGSTAYDSSGNANNGTITGAGPVDTGLRTGPYGNDTFGFDGDDDKIELPPITPENITLSSWVYINTTNGSTSDPSEIFGAYDNSGNRAYRFTLRDSDADGDNSALYLKLSIDGTTYSQSSAEVIETGNWYHIAGTYDGNKMVGYINGSEVFRDSSPSGPIDQHNDTLFISSYGKSAGNKIDGRLSDMRIYNRALTPQEVSYLYEHNF